MDLEKKRAALNFPPVQVKWHEDETGVKIWDTVRQKNFMLTPEEWVRQHVVHFLIDYKSVPKQMIAVEKQFKVGRLQKRLDIAVYNTQIHPVMLVECKAPHVKLHQKIIEQSLRYNLTLQVSYLLITNGISHYAYQLDYASQRMIPLKVLPDYQTMIKGCEV